MPSLSIVIPTRDRGASLMETLAACRRHGEGQELEFVVVDLGSRDDTPARLEALAAEEPRLTWRRLEDAASPAAARNLGAALARHEVVLFLDDTVRPADSGFFKAHAEVHARWPSPGTLVLGRVGWAERPTLGSELLEPLAPEAVGSDLTPYGWHDWRAARGLNLSVKKSLATDWATEGFDTAFAPYAGGPALDAVELAFRRAAGGTDVRLFHAPAAFAVDAAGWNLEGLMRRHADAAPLARALVARHGAEILDGLGLARLESSLAGTAGSGDAGAVADYLAMIEGVKSWSRLYDSHAPGDGEAMKAALSLAFAEGWILSAPAGANLASGCRCALESFRQRVNRAVQSAATGLPAQGGAVEGQGAAVPAWHPPRRSAVGRLRAWARQKPALVRAYLWLRAVQGR
ncbi:glycosyltransferase family 2 protein [Azospirillum sp.]|uniref:glycosyltransferase family 2 protein n=1 Tax=Azospirillum sp. TaxID=34012 RepID=UPI002D38C0F1|nr:glycosyltransferase [Azospirillum sp.]HYD64293.1 glycosyltransferase [Azospirillum sp.]